MTGSVHGNCVDIEGFGIVILGPPGSGKSDLTLRLIETDPHGRTQLVADDRIVFEHKSGTLIARAPEALAGLLEIRGLGLVQYPHKAHSTPRLIVRLQEADEIERLPDFPHETAGLFDVQLPVLALYPWHISAPQKLRAAMDILRGRISLGPAV